MAIVAVTTGLVVLGAVILRVFDHEEYSSIGEALWFTLQTVTTVGYGDNVPERPIGRLVAAVIMLTSIGLITVVTAVITSTFIAAARTREGAVNDGDDLEGAAGIHVSLDAIALRLERLEAAILARVEHRPEDVDQPEQ